MKPRLEDGLGVLGFVLVVVGLWRWSPTAALIGAGVLLLGAGLVVAWRSAGAARS